MRSFPGLEVLESRLLFSTSALPTFLPPAKYLTGQSARHVVAGDFNGDGFLDLAVTNISTDSDTISILLNRGNGTYAKAINYKLRYGPDKTVLAPENLVTADFNGDGHLDLAVVTRNADTSGIDITNTTKLHDGLTIFYGVGNGTFAGQTDYRIFHGTHSIAVGDFNGDGHPDLAITAVSGVGVALNDGNGLFSTERLYLTGAGNSSSVNVVDLNNDGHPDLAITKGSTRGVRLMFNDGSGTFALGPIYSVPGFPTALTSGDFNDDGNIDLAVASNGYLQGITVFLGQGNGTFVKGPHRSTASFLQSIAAADYNLDGTPDLAVVDFASSVRMDLGFGDGSFATPFTLRGGTEAVSVISADLNNDGKPDLVVVRHDSVYVLLNTTTPATPV